MYFFVLFVQLHYNDPTWFGDNIFPIPGPVIVLLISVKQFQCSSIEIKCMIIFRVGSIVQLINIMN